MLIAASSMLIVNLIYYAIDLNSLRSLRNAKIKKEVNSDGLRELEDFISSQLPPASSSKKYNKPYAAGKFKPADAQA